ncbi:MAG: radical SAM protein [Ruminiclostridium sp.]|nr:radical SAM protein [Ruminiclostridium sp.]
MNEKIKPLVGLQRVPLHEHIPLDTPFSVYIFPTNHCNFRCNYCSHSLSLPQFKEQYGFAPETMSMDIYKASIDQLTEFPGRVKTISLTGQGEPLVNPELPQMVAYAKERNAANRIEFMSNGALLTEERSAALVDAGLDCIRISLQGLSTEKYKKVCGSNVDFERFVEQITWLYRHKKQCEVFVKIMDIALEKGEDEKFYKMFTPIADRVYIEQCRPVYSGVASTEGISTKADRYGHEHTHRTVCPLCFFMLGIFPNGDVYPCETIYRPELLGNVKNDRLTDMWNSDKMHEFQMQQLTEGKNANPRCALCCAPDDVSQPEDVLDNYSHEILERLSEKWN